LQIVSNDIAESNTLAETLSGSLAGMDIVAVATPDETNEKAQNFIKSFNLAFGLPLQNTSNPALAFDATNILLQVIKEVGTEGAKIKDALYMLKEYEGVMGTISFDDNGDVEGVDYGVKHWEGNTVVQTERIKVGR
ncbi:MAG: ABC transporter substrate-binding protein, partial [Candidatus Peribacteraceae bacterium]|nr:ABC transporter substrate-binding protein [Candidatus Peribacteraceae bacterium]